MFKENKNQYFYFHTSVIYFVPLIYQIKHWQPRAGRYALEKDLWCLPSLRRRGFIVCIYFHSKPYGSIGIISTLMGRVTWTLWVMQARPRINCKRRNKIFFLFLWVFEKKLLFLCFYGRRAGTSDLFVNIYFLRLSMANSSLYN